MASVRNILDKPMYVCLTANSGLDGRKIVFDFLATETKPFLLFTTSRANIKPAQPPRQKKTGADSQGVKWPVCAAHHWLPAVPSSIMRGPVSPRPFTSSLSAAVFTEGTNLFSWYDAASLLNKRRHYCQVVFMYQHILCECKCRYL
jgi:hypothetical protein